jgi:hypothetical protein
MEYPVLTIYMTKENHRRGLIKTEVEWRESGSREDTRETGALPQGRGDEDLN